MRKIGILLLAASCGIMACSKKTASPTPAATSTTSTTTPVEKAPLACFSAPPGILELITHPKVDTGASVTFLDCTTNGSGAGATYDYDFGDGTAHSHVPQPTHIFKKVGTYTVNLSVTSSGGKYNNKSVPSTITIGERYLTKIVINSINPINSVTGKPWDAGSTGPVGDSIGPDLAVQVGYDTASGFLFDTHDLKPFDNVTTNASGGITTAGGVVWDLNASAYKHTVKLTAIDWDFNLVDEVYNAAGTSFSSRNMLPIKVNPVDGFASKPPYTFISGKYSISFYWEIATK